MCNFFYILYLNKAVYLSLVLNYYESLSIRTTSKILYDTGCYVGLN